MKANRKFRGDDEAVSPVIAVILMVAITVVLAATVYVWVSGFSGGGTPSKSISLSSNGAISTSGVKNYTIASASQGMKWNDLKYTLDGADLAYDGGTVDSIASFASGDFYVVDAGARATGTSIPTGTIDAGDSLVLMHSSLSGKTLRLVDSQSNSVVLTLTVG